MNDEMNVLQTKQPEPVRAMPELEDVLETKMVHVTMPGEFDDFGELLQGEMRVLTHNALVELCRRYYQGWKDHGLANFGAVDGREWVGTIWPAHSLDGWRFHYDALPSDYSDIVRAKELI